VITDHARLLQALDKYKERLKGEVVTAYVQRGESYGRERFDAWRKQFSKFLDDNLPGESARLNAKLTHIAFMAMRGETDVQRFWREDGENMESYIDSLVLDITNNEYDPPKQKTAKTAEANKEGAPSNRVFIVHGHDELLKTKAARFLEKLGFEPIILHEQASKGKTIIEKIEEYTDVGFAVVLYTADDKGASNADAEKGTLAARARQNVVFEHGYLIAKLGRNRVVPLVGDKVELPSNISGIVYVSKSDWQLDIAKEMKAAGYTVDFNRVL
jgi:predicted nucleotide-binding protein